MQRRGVARGVRGALAGSLTTTLALAFHLAGGGTLPSTVAIAGSFGGAIWLSILIGRRRRSLPFLVAAVAASQLLLHTIFAASTAEASISGGGHAGHDGASAIEFALGHGGQAMWWAHAIAGLITVVALHRGERILQRLGELAAVVVRAILRIVLVVPAAPAVVRLPAAARRLLALRPAHPRAVPALRGPPVSSVI